MSTNDDLRGATHYSTMKDGVRPQMYYKKMPIGYADGTFKNVWHYLSFASLWVGSEIKAGSIEEANLIPIKEF